MHEGLTLVVTVSIGMDSVSIAYPIHSEMINFNEVNSTGLWILQKNI